MTIDPTHSAGFVQDTHCTYPTAICAQLRWLNRRVFYQFLSTGCPEIDLEASLSVADNQADLSQRLAAGVPGLRTMPPLQRGHIHHDHSALLRRRDAQTLPPSEPA
ncbi:hypothetical protein [Halothiobacillus sp. DCM-1]|uniref:hypothetical protein n=1 Tax=Halothiobacillus sp. DCM-1 TaxID=3112558 RepID=UPI003253D474